MKSKFTTIDLRAVIAQLSEKLLGLRVANVYDIDNKTYLLRLTKPEVKETLLIESGIRLNSTDFEWPKNQMPSQFSMKLRKHLRTRRLVALCQLGMDRIVDLQFGSNEAAYHLIIELYDRGNIMLTDYQYTILNLLRPRTDQSQDVRFSVREPYPLTACRQPQPPLSIESLRSLLLKAKEGDTLRKVLNPQLAYGPALIEHCLLTQGFPENAKIGQGFDIGEDLPRLRLAIEDAESYLERSGQPGQKGYIIQKSEKKVNLGEGETSRILTYVEYHPFLFMQHQSLPHLEFDSFDKTVDTFFSSIGSQKLDMKNLQQEKTALKKLDNVKKDHEKRIDQLQSSQESDKRKAELIQINLSLVDNAITVIRSAIANQIDWPEIGNIIKEATERGDPAASSIKSLKLQSNQITMLLGDPFGDDGSDEESTGPMTGRPVKIDIDLDLSAYANARKYYDQKKGSAKKEQKTLDASHKALKSAQQKTKQALKEMAVVSTISRARKTYWFEKFHWFISSENYLVIGGRDQQQNELIVKKYLDQGDIYVHAGVQGASTVVIKNHTTDGNDVPPKTLTEAGAMAMCYSVAWEHRVVTSAFWVHHHQVSKTAPPGEYLTPGSFMIRGRRNFLPHSHLVMGFGFLFRLDDTALWRHKDERRPRPANQEEEEVSSAVDELSVGSTESLSDGASSQGEGRGEVGGEGEEVTEGEGSRPLEEEDPDYYPDTTISLQHVGGEKFELQRKQDPDQGVVEGVVYLGDDTPVVLNQAKPDKARISAKQKKELKKGASQNADGDNANSGADREKEEEEQPSTANHPLPSKRGQKAKLKKIKEKYGDQDEEERRLKMELLASAGAPKEKLKKKKGGKKQQQYIEQHQQQHQQRQKNRPKPKNQQQNKKPDVSEKRSEEVSETVGAPTQEDQEIPAPPFQETAADAVNETAAEATTEVTIEVSAEIATTPPLEPCLEEGVVKPAVFTRNVTGLKEADIEEEQVDSDEEREAVLVEEKIEKVEDEILDTLTGSPHPEDTLLFAIPVTAPYSAMANYKFRVKLTPGTTRRGKAAKIALNIFSGARDTTPRQKDLFKGVKDVDISRNIPGKVKVSAPNLHKHK